MTGSATMLHEPKPVQSNRRRFSIFHNMSCQHLPLLLLSLCFSSLTSGQRSVKIAFNLQNCEAHSRQIESLGEVVPSVDKVILLGAPDSAVTPWIKNRFKLNDVTNLRVEYLSLMELNSLFSPMGGSMVYVLDGIDTSSVFPVEQLTERVAWINHTSPIVSLSGSKEDARPNKVQCLTGKRNSTQPHPQFDEEHRVGYVSRTIEKFQTPISSNTIVVATSGSLWVLDQLLGNLHRVSLRDDSIARASNTWPIKDLLPEATNASTFPFAGQIDQTSLTAEKMILVDAETDRVALFIECLVSSNGANTFYRIALTLNDGEPAIAREIRIDPREDGLFPALGLSGFTVIGTDTIGQILRMWDDTISYPIFGGYSQEGEQLILKRVEPYDYRTSRWRTIPAFNLVNGHFADEYFVYSIAPLFVHLTSWNEIDVAGQLGLSSDSALLMMPGYYGTMDMRSDSSGVTLLYLSKGDVHLAQFDRHADKLNLTRLDKLDRHYVQAQNVVLLDRKSFVVFSSAVDTLVVGRISEE